MREVRVDAQIEEATAGAQFPPMRTLAVAATLRTVVYPSENLPGRQECQRTCHIKHGNKHHIIHVYAQCKPNAPIEGATAGAQFAEQNIMKTNIP